MSEKIDLLLDLMQETRSDIREIREGQVRQEEHIRENKESLIEHIRRTDLLQEDLDLYKKETDDRLSGVEEPQKFMRTVVKVSMGIGAILGAVLGILKLVEIL